MNSLLQLAKSALQQSKRMNDFAQKGRWDELTGIQKEHSKEVEKIMLAEADEEIKTELRMLLIEIKETNNQTMALAEIVKQELVQEKKNLGQAVKMQKALDAFK